MKTGLKKTKLYLFLSLVEFLRPGQTGQVQGGGAAPSCCCPGEMETTVKEVDALWKYSPTGVGLLSRLRKASCFLKGSIKREGGIFGCNYVKVCALVGKGHSYLMA